MIWRKFHTMDVVSLFVQITTIKTLIFIDSHNQTTVVKSPMLSVFFPIPKAIGYPFLRSWRKFLVATA